MLGRRYTIIALATLLSIAVACRRATPEQAPAGASIDLDLRDVTVAQLHRPYADKKYTVIWTGPWSVAVDPTGYILVADTYDNVVD
jgi:hypothetical protein